MGELLKFVLEGTFELGNAHSKLVIASHYLPAIPKSNVIWNAVFPAGTVYETTFWNAENTHIDLECRVWPTRFVLHIPFQMYADSNPGHVPGNMKYIRGKQVEDSD